jgi:hypothetical protein
MGATGTRVLAELDVIYTSPPSAMTFGHASIPNQHLDKER